MIQLPPHRKESLRLVIRFGMSLVVVSLLSADARSSLMPRATPRWSLARIASAECDPACGAADRLSAKIAEELGSLAGDVDFSTTDVASVPAKDADALALIDPLGRIVARFSDDSEPRRIASRIRVFLVGRFDPELAES